MTVQSDIALVPVERDLDVTTVDDLRTSIDRLIGRGCHRIILNMSGCSYVDSAGMALLLGETRHMRQVGGLLSLTNVSSQVLAILRRARLVDFVPVSRAGAQDKAAELPADAQPLWRTVIPIDCHDLSCTRASIERLLRRIPLSPDELFDATLAAGEAVGNAVDHTDGTGAMVTVSGYDDRAVIEVSDCGEGFDPTQTPAEPHDPCAERGRGIQMMRLLADSVTISPRSIGVGTLVRIVKIARAATD